MKTAEYQEGWDAYENNNYRVKCPYEHGTTKYEDWVTGWSDAFEYWTFEERETYDSYWK